MQIKKKLTKLLPIKQNKTPFIPGQIKIHTLDYPCRLHLKTFFGNPMIDIFNLKFNYNDSTIATGLGDGSVKVYSVLEGKPLYMMQVSKNKQYPVTCLQWHPIKHDLLISSSSDGLICWLQKHLTLAKVLMDKPSYCFDIAIKGQWMAVGTQNQIYIIDNQTQKIIKVLNYYQKYQQGTTANNYRGHTNRIFALKMVDQNLFISGGWDSTIRIWDYRQFESMQHIQGPNLSGDGLDYKQGKILTGSYRNQQMLQLWDLKTFQRIRLYDWSEKNHEAIYCYSCQFGKKKKFMNKIAAGTTGLNEVKIFEQDTGILAGYITLQAGCYTVDFGNQSNLFCCSGAQGVFYIFTYL